MSYVYVDGRGGARDGAGRKKALEVKKAFRVTDSEKEFIKKMRLLHSEDLRFLINDLEKRFESSRYRF